MRQVIGFLVLALVVVLARASSAAPQQRKEYDVRFLAEIRAADAAAGDIFEQALVARDKGDFAEVDRLLATAYGRTHVGGHIERRWCGAKSELGQHAKAIALCREAITYRDSAENQAGMAVVLLQSDASPKDAEEAMSHARRAVGMSPDDADFQTVLGRAAMQTQDLATLGEASKRAVALAPTEPGPHVLRAIYFAAQGQTDEAEEQLTRAHLAGLPDAAYDDLRNRFDGARPLPNRIFSASVKVFGLWAAGMALLLAAAWLLSRATMRAATELAGRQGDPPRGASVIRRLYGVVLFACCVYYYASFPLVLLATVGAAAGFGYLCLVIGRIPIGLVATAAIIVFVTVVAMFKSIFVKVRDDDPGAGLDFTKHPELRAVLDEVAAAIHTRPVDKAYMVPGVSVAVFERGGVLKQLRGASERCLVLGVGVLDGMSVRELKSILAHEYGHFRNEDTARGGFALAVRRSLISFAMQLAIAGAARPYNPAWLFVSGFYKVFLRVSHGASRLQEILADRWAAHAYGSEAFVRGLSHVVEQSVRFDAHADATLREVIEAKHPLSNLYQYTPTKPAEAGEVAKAAEEALARATSPYDSHPAPTQRIAWVRALAITLEGAPADERPAWDLFGDREELERQMTDEVREKIAAEHGISIPREGKPKAPVQLDLTPPGATAT